MKQSGKREPRLKVFRDRFELLRQQHDLSNTDFAKFLEMSRQTVGFYLNGERVPDALTLIKIAEKCNVSADWLLGLTNIQNPDTNIASTIQYLGLSDSATKMLLAIKNAETKGLTENAKLLPSTLDKFLSNAHIIMLLHNMQSYIDVYKKVVSYNEFGYRDEIVKCLEFEGIPLYDFDILKIKFESISDALGEIVDEIADEECLQRDCDPRFR